MYTWSGLKSWTHWTSWHAGSSNHHSTWSAEFPRRSRHRLELTSYSSPLIVNSSVMCWRPCSSHRHRHDSSENMCWGVYRLWTSNFAIMIFHCRHLWADWSINLFTVFIAVSQLSGACVSVIGFGNRKPNESQIVPALAEFVQRAPRYSGIRSGYGSITSSAVGWRHQTNAVVIDAGVYTWSIVCLPGFKCWCIAAPRRAARAAMVRGADVRLNPTWLRRHRHRRVS